MKKRIIIAAAFTACLALCATVWPQTAMVEETPTPAPTPTVTTSQPPLPESEELVMPVITEKEAFKTPDVKSVPEVTAEKPSSPAPEIEKQTKPDLLAQPEPEHESTTSNSEDMVYVPGFGWIESQGPSHVEYAEDVYENGNKIGIMG